MCNKAHVSRITFTLLLLFRTIHAMHNYTIIQRVRGRRKWRNIFINFVFYFILKNLGYFILRLKGTLSISSCYFNQQSRLQLQLNVDSCDCIL